MLSPIKYLQEVQSEIKKVSWPDKKQTLNMTLLVIGVCTAVALYLTGLDLILKKVINFLINK